MSEAALMDMAERAMARVRRQHGDGLEAFVALTKAFVAIVGPQDLGLVAAPAELAQPEEPVETPPAAPQIAPPRPLKQLAPPKPAAAAPEATGGGAPAPVKLPAPKPAAKPKPQTSIDPPIVRDGITISFDRGAEALEFRSMSRLLTGRQAQFLAVLLRGAPHPIGRDFVARKLWAGERIPEFYDQVLSELASTCRTLLAPIGLDVKTMRGVGIALQVLETPQAPERAE